MRQRVQKGGFARLTGRVDEEILLGFDEPQNVIVYIPKGIDHVVILWATQPGGIEVSFHSGKDSNYETFF